jgi:hypothetical protein
MLSENSSIWFSAYGVGWGYCAFSLPSEVVRKQLGAANESPKQLMLAFELNKRRLLHVVTEKYLPQVNERITLADGDL